MSDSSQSLTETQLPLNMSKSLPLAFATEVHRAEGNFRRLSPHRTKQNVQNFDLAHVGQRFIGAFKSHTRKTWNRFNIKDSYTWNNTKYGNYL